MLTSTLTTEEKAILLQAAVMFLSRRVENRYFEQNQKRLARMLLQAPEDMTIGEVKRNHHATISHTPDTTDNALVKEAKRFLHYM